MVNGDGLSSAQNCKCGCHGRHSAVVPGSVLSWWLMLGGIVAPS